MKIVPPPEEEGDFIYSDFPTNLRDLVQTDNAKHEISEGIPGQRNGHEKYNTSIQTIVAEKYHLYLNMKKLSTFSRKEISQKQFSCFV